MTRFRSLTMAMALVATAVPAALAQQPAPRPGTAVISGENPYIRLLDKADGKTLTMVSFWRVHWSPAGTGHVCYVTVGEAGEKGAVRLALHDNERLYQYLTNEILALTNPTYKDRPFTAVGSATFTPGGDSIKERTETCRSKEHTVQLAWRGLQTPELIDILPGSRPNNPFGLTFLRIIGQTAEVTINGTRAPGTTFGGSALAFGESWLKK
jgi:hypothetical protein